MATWRNLSALVLAIVLAGCLLPAREDDTIESIVQRIRDTKTVVPASRPFLTDLSYEVVNLTRTYHYSRRGITRETSQEWFDEYFDLLDRNRSFFLQADIDEFQSTRDVLAFQVSRQKRIEFAFDVYGRLMQRVKEWAVYAADHIDDNFDFTTDEELVIDRHELPRAQTVEELHAIWHQQLKNSLLLLDLERQEREANRAEAALDLAAVKPEAKPEAEATAPPADPQQAPAEVEPEPEPKLVVLKRYERYLARRVEVDAMDVVEMFLTSLTHVYDPHSTYMAPATSEDFNIDMRLSLTGIGARLTADDGYVTVTEVLTGGPAERDGRLKAGDRIVAVGQDGEKAEDVVDKPLDKVVQKIRGEKGTKVLLTVVDKASGAKSVIDLVRDVVKLEDQSAKSETLEIEVPGKEPTKAKVAVIYLPSFYRDFGGAATDAGFKSSGNDIRRLITEAGGTELDGVVLDLRDNGGGALEEAVAIAGLFFGEGPVVQVQGTNGRPQKRFDQDPTMAYDGPLVVLVNKSSASASEIVAAALQDYHRAVIVGDSSTHGKGTVQQKMDLNKSLHGNPDYANDDAGALKLTLAKYYRVTGGSTQLRGVVPDVVLPSYSDYMEMGEAKIPHAMEWDEIQPARFACDVDVRPYLPELLKRSAERRANDPEFQRLVADIEHYGERRQRKTLPLNLEARRKLIQEEEQWGKKLREALSVGKNRRPRGTSAEPGGKPEDTAPTKAEDMVMDEALAVLADLISLQHDPTFKAVAAKDAAAATGANALENELQ